MLDRTQFSGGRRKRRNARRRDHTSGTFSEIPIEVVISDQPWVLQRKISAYLKNGAYAACCAYPNLKRVTVYTAHEWRELSEQDHLEFPTLLPGLSIPVSAIFDGA
jgi:Uma2 family endonuclease